MRANLPVGAFGHAEHMPEVIDNGQPKCIWRLMGCKLADAMKGSSMQRYYELLQEVVRIAQADIALLEQADPTLCVPVPAISEEPPTETDLKVPEKVLDYRVKGSGV